MIDVPKVKQLIADKDSNGLANYIKLHQLKLTNNKITANLDQIKITVEYWDKKQQVKKNWTQLLIRGSFKSRL